MHRTLHILSNELQFSSGTLAKFEISLLGKLPITTALTQHFMAYNNTEDISEMPSG